MGKIIETKVKYLFDEIFKGVTPVYSEDENEYVIFGQRNNSKKGMSFADCKYANEHFFNSRPNYEFLKFGDVLINGLGGGTCGRVGFFDIDMDQKILTDGIPFILRNKNYNKYFYYLLLSRQNYLEDLALGATNQVSLKDFDLKNAKLPLVVDINKQKEIVNFLDKKCSLIFEATVMLEKEIELLEKYKKALVYKTIKNGLKGTEQKATGHDVWDAIPKNWELMDIKYIFIILKRIAGREGFDVLSVTQKGLKVKDTKSGDGQLAENYSGYQFVYPGDYVMNHMDLLTGWIDLSNMFGVTSPDYRVFSLRDKNNQNSEYYKYVMQCCYMNKIFYSLGQGVSTLGRWRLQTDSFNNFKIPVPPKEEQDEIATFLATKINSINSIIEEKENEIEKLYEIKKSLVNEYATGKKEVPHE